MKFLEEFLINMVGKIGLDPNSPIWINAFLAKYTVSIVEVLILFVIVLFIIQYIMSFISPLSLKSHLEKAPPLLSHILASILGAVTPFCTCAGIPLFTGMIKSNVPVGPAFSFLITSPLVNEIAFAAIWAIFGAKIAFIYLALGLGAGIIGGMILGKLKVERYFTIAQGDSLDFEDEGSLSRSRVSYAWDMSMYILKPVLPFLFIGIGVGIALTLSIPMSWISHFSGTNQFLAIPLAIVVGAPIYMNITAAVAIIGGLVAKGLGTGTAFALIMSIGGMSFPEWTILAGIMKRRLLFIFIAITATMILISSYLFALLDLVSR
ncbi:MAG: permease [Brevinema sp.]